jgi:hypothetical protein
VNQQCVGVDDALLLLGRGGQLAHQIGRTPPIQHEDLRPVVHAGEFREALLVGLQRRIAGRVDQLREMLLKWHEVLARGLETGHRRVELAGRVGHAGAVLWQLSEPVACLGDATVGDLDRVHPPLDDAEVDSVAVGRLALRDEFL